MKVFPKLITAIVICTMTAACQQSESHAPPPTQPNKRTTPSGETGQGQAPADEQQSPEQQRAQVPAPTTHAASPVVLATVLKPQDNLTRLLAAYLSERTPQRVPEIGNDLMKEVFSERDLIGPKIFQLQNSVAKVAEAGAYNQESENRVALLQANMRAKIRDDAQAATLGHGVLIVGTAAAVGALAGLQAYRYVPELIPAAGRRAAQFLRNSREEIAEAYARAKTGTSEFVGRQRENLSRAAQKVRSGEALQQAKQSVSNAASSAKQKVTETADSVRQTVHDTRDAVASAPGRAKAKVREVGAAAQRAKSRVEQTATESVSKVRTGVNEVKERVRMPAEQAAARNLEAFELPHEQAYLVRNLERANRTEVQGHQFMPTDMYGFKYAVVDHWHGQDLGINRRILFEVKRMGGAGPANYAVTQEIRADQAGAIVSQLEPAPATSEASQLGRFAYFWNPIEDTITPVRASVKQLMSRLSERGKQMLPIFDRIDWPNAIGTAAATGALSGIWYYKAYENGFDNGEMYANLDLERLVPTTATVKAPESKSPMSPPRRLPDGTPISLR